MRNACCERGVLKGCTSRSPRPPDRRSPVDQYYIKAQPATAFLKAMFHTFPHPPHLAEVAGVVLVPHDAVVVLATSVTAAARVLAVLADTAMARRHVAALLAVGLEACGGASRAAAAWRVRHGHSNSCQQQREQQLHGAAAEQAPPLRCSALQLAHGCCRCGRRCHDCCWRLLAAVLSVSLHSCPDMP